MNRGKLYLIPTSLGEESEETIIPYSTQKIISKIDIFIVENIRTARRTIKKIDKKKDINQTTFYAYGKNNTLNLKEEFLDNILKGIDIGLLSEAGTPCIADPGAKVVDFAHKFNIDVVPCAGSSSILLALMGSGMNGQNFAFNGYLAIEKKKRNQQIKKLEKITRDIKQTQIFIETPYRNNQMFNSLINICNNKTKLCIATNLTMPSEKIMTKSIEEWKQCKINIHKKPTIFLINQNDKY